jgi:hypothetical protein
VLTPSICSVLSPIRTSHHQVLMTTPEPTGWSLYLSMGSVTCLPDRGNGLAMVPPGWVLQLLSPHPVGDTL